MAAHAVIALAVVGAVCGPQTALDPLAVVSCMLKILGKVSEAVIEQQHKRQEQEQAQREIQQILGAVHANPVARRVSHRGPPGQRIPKHPER